MGRDKFSEAVYLVYAISKSKLIWGRGWVFWVPEVHLFKHEVINSNPRGSEHFPSTYVTPTPQPLYEVPHTRPDYEAVRPKPSYHDIPRPKSEYEAPKIAPATSYAPPRAAPYSPPPASIYQPPKVCIR